MFPVSESYRGEGINCPKRSTCKLKRCILFDALLNHALPFKKSDKGAFLSLKQTEAWEAVLSTSPTSHARTLNACLQPTTVPSPFSLLVCGRHCGFASLNLKKPLHLSF